MKELFSISLFLFLELSCLWRLRAFDCLVCFGHNRKDLAEVYVYVLPLLAADR